MSKTTSSEKVSPTAYATGYFWYRHGMSHPALATPQGKRLDRAFGVMIKGTRALSGVSLSAMMLARHKGIDAVLTRAIEDGRVSQVIEIAAGLSPRGLTFARRYGDRITYLETDLPAMAATKRKLLDKAGLLSDHHRVIELDALEDSGPQSLAQIVMQLDARRGTAIITEGLMNYLDPASAKGVWRRISKNLGKFPQGVYLADVYLRPEQASPAMIAFGAMLSAFVRRRMHVHFRTPEDAAAAMHTAGFKSTKLHKTSSLPETRELSRTPGGDRVHVLEARISKR